MASNYKLNYAVDLVFCIDTTMSMDHIIDTVKENALNFYSDVSAVMEKKHKKISQLRLRIVAFKDYLADGEQAMQCTDFFVLPDSKEEFKDCISGITADGGGDDPEDGLEALAYAIRSDWNRSEQKRRHVIVVWSDEGTHELGFGRSSEYYYDGMPADFNELTEWWGSSDKPGYMDEAAKRLIIFAPAKEGWNSICENWNNVIHIQSEAGDGLESVDYQELLNIICNSI